MDLEAEIDGLFQVPLGDFTEARNELAARLRSVDAAAAARVKSIAKPVASAWAVNQLCFREPEALRALVAAGARLRLAQQAARAASELRQAMGVWRGTLTAAAKRAAGFLGKGESPAVLRRIEGTLQALALRGTIDAEPRAGRLTADLEPPGIDATLEGLASGPGDAAARSPAGGGTADSSGGESGTEARRRLDLAQAEAEASHLRRRAGEADAEAAAAERRLEGAWAELAEAERRLAHARELVARAEKDVSLGRSRRDEAQAALAEAEASVKATRRSMDESH